ncbi:MAG: phosphoglucosamine mutase [Gammaproteobacteria bacterium PRO9]|nr:phosphoglucosamine mutase [Gammaproteobacteria bacterium PRO9]
MSRTLFGTDGIRGRVGQHPMTAEFALRLASAAGRVLAPEGGKVLIGKDTRVSGYMFESALEAGFVAVGMDVLLVGPMPTPGIAHLTRTLGADVGVVISASHNPYEDNGIKFFDAHGSKLSDAIESSIEARLVEPPVTCESSSLGRAKRVENALDVYQEFCLSTVPAGLRLDGLKIVIDCSHGAAYKVAPRVLSALGAEIVPIGCSPNGRNINDGCGSTRPELMRLTTKGVGADLGIALDGDGDRVLMVDHRGELVDGDQLLWILANAWQEAGRLRGPVVGTLMTNLGLEHSLRKLGIDFLRAKVGDRYVLEMLHEKGGCLGGETSGHLLCLDKTTTGDGLVSALQVLAVMKQSGRTLADLTAGMPRYPQKLVNVRIVEKLDLGQNPVIRSAVAEAEQRLGARGRVVLRASGTEPVVRVMVEGEDGVEVERLANDIAASVRGAAAG